MSLVIGLLTFILVLTSLLLTLLILIQLPKKEAGAGLAFGGAASDALFGAGSGTVLSRITKYGAGVFLALSLILSVLQTHRAKASNRGLLKEIANKASAAAVTSTAATPTNQALPLLQSTLTNLSVPSLTTSITNAPGAAPKPAPVTPEAPAK